MGKFKTILVDPPWRYDNRTGKPSPEHGRLFRYSTMTIDELEAMRPSIDELANRDCHLWMWCTWPMLNDGLRLMESWGFEYKTGIPWIKTAKDGTPDGRCMGFYGRVVSEILLFGVRSEKGTFRTRPPHNTKNVIHAPKRDHSRKPDEQYELIEKQSYEPRIELFARTQREGWDTWGDEVDCSIQLPHQAAKARGAF